MADYKIETKCVQGGYTPGNGEPRQIPIVQSTTFHYDTSEDMAYNYIPKGYAIPEDADYFHVTSNNTIYGTEIREDLESPVPMIADMSSDIFSRPVDVSKYICIYGGDGTETGGSGKRRCSDHISGAVFLYGIKHGTDAS